MRGLIFVSVCYVTTCLLVFRISLPVNICISVCKHLLMSICEYVRRCMHENVYVNACVYMHYGFVCVHVSVNICMSVSVSYVCEYICMYS